jgi:predicted RNase H-like HicB family nuclease
MKSKGKKKVTATVAQGSYGYKVYFEPQSDGSFAVVFPKFPEIVTFGRTLDEARAMARDALRCHLEGLRKRNGVPILPKQRGAQLVTPEIVNRLRDEP